MPLFVLALTIVTHLSVAGVVFQRRGLCLTRLAQRQRLDVISGRFAVEFYRVAFCLVMDGMLRSGFEFCRLSS